MKISFVIPAFNEEHYLGKTLESVTKAVAGRWDEFEIIVVNNASSDNTTQVALSFPHVKLVNEPRKGLSQARQSGFVVSSGELIANVDADCLVPAGWIDTVLKNFNANPKLVALSGPHVFYDLSKWANLGISFYYRVGYVGYLLNRFVMRNTSLLQGGNFVIRREALQKVGGFNPAFEFYGEDADIAKRLHKIGPVKFTFKLPMYASARRIKHEGLFTMMIRYPLNLIWTNLFGKPFTQTYINVRPAPKK